MAAIIIEPKRKKLNQFMIKIKIFTIGKNKEEWLTLALNEYLTRLKPYLSVEWCLFKDDAKLYELASLEKNLILLDERGKDFTSIEFSHFLMKEIEIHHSKLSFLIGGAYGIPKEFLEKHPSFRLSSMTWSHQTVRLLLVEQLYRAFEIHKGSPYHK
jgi:23S rRNA (pseudouridine1915-N3)-methyltransferase